MAASQRNPTRYPAADARSALSDPSSPEASLEAPPLGSRLTAWWASRDWPLAILVGGVATIAAVIVLRIWVVPLSVPLRYSGDANQVMLTIKQIAEGGWFYENTRVGVPFGLDMHDFPDGGHIQYASFKVAGWLTGGAVGATFNVTFLGGYFAIAATGFWVLRRLGVARPWAAALGVLYAHLPYHLIRLGHHYLALYVAAPLALLLVVRQFEGPPAFLGPAGRLRLNWADPSTRVALVGGAVAGATGPYYAIFSGLILVVTGVIVFLADRNRRRLISTILVAAVVGLTLLLSMAPSVAYRMANGPNSEAAVRSYSDVERYALKPVHMLLPISFHRIELFREPMATAVTGLPTEAGQNLGLVGAFGLVALMTAGLSSLVGRSDRSSRRTRLLFLIVAGVTVAAASGGFGAVLGILGFTQIRAWNRIVVFIAFALFIALGSWLTIWWRTRSSRIAWVVAGMLMLFGVFDQTSPVSDASTEARRDEWESDSSFVEQIEATLPDDAMVFQLPYVRYPENGHLERMVDYDLLKGYLHSTNLRWSYPVMRGRVPDWQTPLLALDEGAMVEGLVAVGFEGLYIDRFGYGDSAAALEASLRQLLAQEPRVSNDGRLVFFDLRPAAFELRSRLTPEEIDAIAASVLGSGVGG